MLDKPIKTLGVHPIRVALHPEVIVGVTANVAKSTEEAEAQEKAGGFIGRGEEEAADLDELLAEVEAAVTPEAPAAEAGEPEAKKKAEPKAKGEAKTKEPKAKEPKEAKAKEPRAKELKAEGKAKSEGKAKAKGKKKG